LGTPSFAIVWTQTDRELRRTRGEGQVPSGSRTIWGTSVPGNGCLEFRNSRLHLAVRAASYRGARSYHSTLPERKPMTFFMSCKQLGDRLQIDRKSASRILRRFEFGYRLINAWKRARFGYRAKSRSPVCIGGSFQVFHRDNLRRLFGSSWERIG
jgi:hypothetical protein